MCASRRIKYTTDIAACLYSVIILLHLSLVIIIFIGIIYQQSTVARVRLFFLHFPESPTGVRTNRAISRPDYKCYQFDGPAHNHLGILESFISGTVIVAVMYHTAMMIFSVIIVVLVALPRQSVQESCSAMAVATSNDDYKTLRDKTFATFRKTCRKEAEKPSTAQTEKPSTTLAEKPSTTLAEKAPTTQTEMSPTTQTEKPTTGSQESPTSEDHCEYSVYVMVVYENIETASELLITSRLVKDCLTMKTVSSLC